MFGRRNHEKEHKDIIDFVYDQLKFHRENGMHASTTTVCEKCGALLFKHSSQIKKVRHEWPTGSNDMTFCGRCKPEYDLVTTVANTKKYYKNEPSQLVEVTEMGTLIGRRTRRSN